MSFPTWFQFFAQQVNLYLPFAVTFGRTTNINQIAVYATDTNTICGTVTYYPDVPRRYAVLEIDYKGQQASKTWFEG